MGLIQSVFCSLTFCVERVLTWTCLAFLLMLLMLSFLMLMVYGISVGYHHAQKELAAFAMASRLTTSTASSLRVGPRNRRLVRLRAVNRSEVQQHSPHPLLEKYQTRKPGQQIYMKQSETPTILLETSVSNRSEVQRAPHPLLEVYTTRKPGEEIFMKQSETPKILLEIERTTKEPELSPHEREVARRIIGRFRRSRNNASTPVSFWRTLRPLNNTKVKAMALI